LLSELQGIDIGTVSYDVIVYSSLETRVDRYCSNWSCYKGLGNVLRATWQRIYEYCCLSRHL